MWRVHEEKKERPWSNRFRVIVHLSQAGLEFGEFLP